MKKRQNKSIVGFSKLSKIGKLKWMVENFFRDPEMVMKELMSYWLIDEEKQKLLDQFSENTISNFHLPYGVAPNFILNGETYCVPMVIEESSVVAAAAYAAKFWARRGGFHAEVQSTDKIGQVHFTWTGPAIILQERLTEIEQVMRQSAASILSNMEARGGGVKSIELVNLSFKEPDLFHLQVTFDTRDSMGANFINSVLEDFAKTLTKYAQDHDDIREQGNLEEKINKYSHSCEYTEHTHSRSVRNSSNSKRCNIRQ